MSEVRTHYTVELYELGEFYILGSIYPAGPLPGGRKADGTNSFIYNKVYSFKSLYTQKYDDDLPDVVVIHQ